MKKSGRRKRAGEGRKQSEGGREGERAEGEVGEGREVERVE